MVDSGGGVLYYVVLNGIQWHCMALRGMDELMYKHVRRPRENILTLLEHLYHPYTTPNYRTPLKWLLRISTAPIKHDQKKTLKHP